jgi:hypothetical protein
MESLGGLSDRRLQKRDGMRTARIIAIEKQENSSYSGEVSTRKKRKIGTNRRLDTGGRPTARPAGALTNSGG